ncbi:MAG: Na/Pi cotransporter family protein [Rhodobacteraceae bacterium]|nr:Na/Pi cotransporter family protein [Paracoccaceae bacterium]
MPILSFLLHLAGATMLLLFAVRMVRTGIERGFGAGFQRVLTQQSSRSGAAMSGLGLAVVLQSSAAVALLVSGFCTNGVLTFATGLAVVLGGDLGSALLIQVLSIRLDWLVPLLLASGGWLFVKSDQRRLRQYGRILLGVAFILIALRFLREAMEPIRESAFLPAVADYLASDYLTAFIVGAVLAFVMMSSVATILMCVTLVAIGAIPLEAGISLVLGANLGSAVIPLWLTRDMPQVARRVPIANLCLRGSWALIALLAVNALPITDYLAMGTPAQTLINTHIGFNVLLVIVSLPLLKVIETLVERVLPETETPDDLQAEAPMSVLDTTTLSNPALAQAGLKRELLRMAGLTEQMARPVLEVFETGDKARIGDLRRLDNHVNDALSGIREFVSAMPWSDMSKPDRKAVRQMMEYAINLETAGDIISKRLLPLATEKAKGGIKFSPAGWSELCALYDRVMANMQLAVNVLVSDDLESARQLMAEKSEVSRLEGKSRKKHLKRLASGEGDSFDSSDIHLDALRALKDLNSQYAAVAYPILYKGGQLLETRLITTLDEDEP